jgi:hypothetical protein
VFHRLAFIILAALGPAQTATAQRGSMADPPTVATMVPAMPPPEPERLAAARAFVAALPIRESFESRYGGSPIVDALYRDLVANAADAHPGLNLEAIGSGLRSGIDRRVRQALPAILPAASEEIANRYARSLNPAELAAATVFYGTPAGRAFAVRLVDLEPLIMEPIHARLLEALSPALDAIVAEAEGAERLRQQINARSGH